MDYLIVKINSKQYIVNESSVLQIDRVSTETPIEVLGWGSEDNFEFGGDKSVTFEIIRDFMSPKLLVRRYKSKSRYRVEKGHRQPLSILKVKSISGGGKSHILAQKLEKETAVESVEKQSEKPSVRLVKDLDISDKSKELLIENGYKTVDEFLNAKKDDILAIKGLGEKAYDKIVQAIK